ncbi:MAG: hypothetical protein JNK02_07550 [Planctomycetes bacterium]|nr:hypothetical protein [Planctomycetota bacterium]
MRFPLFAASVLAGSFASFAGAQISPNQTAPVKLPAVKQPPAKPVVPPVRQPMTSFLVGGSDNCANASTNDAISGPGTFAVNNIGATTGSPVASCGLMQNDVWFYWTATQTGIATISTCGGVSGDSVASVWASPGPGVCPTTQLACLDDSCGLQQSLSFPCTSGTSYYIAYGGFNGAQYSGTFTVTQSVASANDNCATPSNLVGTGLFPYDTTAATTGAEGQGEAICIFFGSSAVVFDAWYTWTAPFTGTARMETCGLTSHDSKIAVYNGAGCPTGPALACNDDACAFQTRVDVPVVSGQTYTIQIGSYPFVSSGAAGTLSINQFVPASNDDCSLPVNVVGAGPHPFDTTTATTGSQGQGAALCLAFGSANIYNDVWFTWTAPASGQYEISVCGFTGYDTKLAVYSGAGCPSGGPIACNDDSCGLQSAACFSATAGQTYTIQIGAYGTAGSGTGAFTLTLVPPPTSACAPADDGTSENSLGWTAGGSLVWMSGYGIIGQPTSISAVETTYGTPLFPGGYIPSGPVTIAVWDDPNDDGNPNDAVLLATVTTAVNPGSVDSDVFQTIVLGAPVVANGIFFVGAMVDHPGGQYPAPLDQSGGGTACGAGPGSWFFGSNTVGAVDLSNPSANQYPPLSLVSAGFPGNWLLRAVCGPGSTGTAYCFGDGSGTACPCGNNGATGNGCGHSANANGANLAATGSALLSGDTVVLNGTAMPANASALYFQGTAQLSVVFGDGLRCVGGTVIRLGTKTNSGGASAYPGGGDPSVSVRGLVTTPGIRHYQVWYRNAAAFCTPSTFNLSNGLSITWL